MNAPLEFASVRNVVTPEEWQARPPAGCAPSGPTCCPPVGCEVAVPALSLSLPPLPQLLGGSPPCALGGPRW